MPTTTHVEHFSRALDHAFSLAPVHRTVSAGGARLRLAFADDATADSFVTAFPPAAGEGAPDLSIAVLVGPNPELEPNIPQPRTGHFTFDRDTIYAHWEPIPGETLQIYDRTTRRGLLWVPTGQALETVKSRPALPLLHAHVAPGEWVPVHAAALGRNGRFILLAGPGGSGKSTAAVACAAAGWDFAGDDFVMVEPATRWVEPIYASARLRPGATGAFDDFIRATRIAVTHDYGEERLELRLGAGYKNVPILGGHIEAILLPRRTGAPSFTFRPARPVDTYRAMTMVTVIQLPGLRDRLIPKLVRLSTAVPSFVVDTGPTPDGIPTGLQDFLERLPQ